jgi:predicted small lipoprotein YifL
MEPACPGGQPDLVQRLLQVDDDLAAVCKDQRHHAADTLVVDVGIGLLVDLVATAFDRSKHRLRLVHEFKVGHYNFTMSIAPFQILVRAIVLVASAAALLGCGQKGALVLPTEPAAAQRATLQQSMQPGGMAAPPAAAASAGHRP